MTLPAKPVQVVIAHSHPLYRDGVRAALCASGDFAIVAETKYGEDSLALFESHAPALALVELSLPDISGLEVMRRITEASHQPSVIIIAEQEDENEALSALQSGARGVVPKDIEADALLRAARSVVAGEYWIGRATAATFIDTLRHKTPASKITPREQEIIRVILTGLSNQEIGKQLGISRETVKRHVRNIYDKLGVSTRMELALRVTGGKPERN